VFAAAQLRQPAAVEAAMGEAVRAIVRTIAAASESLKELEKALSASFEQHPDAEILDSLPGLGLVLGARVLGEFGDDPNRFAHAASRRAYAGTAPITRASGRHRAVLARHVRNKRLANACYLWAFTALTKSREPAPSTTAAAPPATSTAPRSDDSAAKLLGQLHHCLTTRQPYDEHLAWTPPAST
jgi:transposase